MKILIVNKKIDEKGGQELVIKNLIDCFINTNQIYILCSEYDKNFIKKYPSVIFIKKIKKGEASSFDLIHFHNPFHFFTFYQILKLRNNKKICTFHSKMFSPNFFKKIILSSYTSIILKIIPFFTDTFIYLTNFDKNLFESKMIIKKPYAIIGNAVEDNFLIKEKIINKNNCVLFVGRLTKSKGFYDIIQLAIKMPKVKFLIVGSGKKPLNIPTNIKLLGVKSREEIFDLYKKAKIFLLPSYSECFPLTILEAMATGTPIICSDIPELKEIVENNKNGILVPTNKPELIKKALVTLFENKNLYKKISKNNIKVANEKNSLLIFKKNHKNIYAK